MRKFVLAVGSLMLTSALALASSVEPLTPTSMITVSGSVLNTGGVQVAVYESEGTLTPPIFLVHGNTSSSYSYAKILNSHFAKHHKVIAIDMPGYGNSEDAAEYNTEFLAEAVASAADQTGASEGIAVGWSLGGDVLLQAAGKGLLPDMKGYFLFGTAPVGAPPAGVTLPSPFLPNPLFPFGATPGLTPEQIVDYVSGFFRPDYRIRTSAMNEFIDEGLRTDPNTRGVIGAVLLGLDPTFGDEIGFLINLGVPVALVLGSEDGFVNPDYLDALAPFVSTLWRGQTIIPNRPAGHALQWEKPHKFIRLLAKFKKHVKRNS